MNSPAHRQVRTGRKGYRASLLLAACLAVAGCQHVPFLRDEAPSDAAAEPPSESAASQDLEQSPVRRAIFLLQDGRERQAERLLEEWMADTGGDATARLLLAQIRQPPEELLGSSFELMTVQPGDSLSEIAGRTMNNELMFYALARLNGIEVPRMLRSGQELRVPSLDMPKVAQGETTEPALDASTAEAERSSQAAAEEEEGAGLVGTAQGLIDAGRLSQAYSLLLSAARAGQLEPPDSELLARAAVDLAAEACAADKTDRAMVVLDQASPWISDNGAQSIFRIERRHLEARMLLDDAQSALQRGQEDRAYRLLMEARDLSADLVERHELRVERLAEALSMSFHDQAFSAWRDQRVEDAIVLWERVVRIAPGFIPAQRYLERARRAQRELRSLEGG